MWIKASKTVGFINVFCAICIFLYQETQASVEVRAAVGSGSLGGWALASWTRTKLLTQSVKTNPSCLLERVIDCPHPILFQKANTYGKASFKRPPVRKLVPLKEPFHLIPVI